jgi:hypothetical protein
MMELSFLCLIVGAFFRSSSSLVVAAPRHQMKLNGTT